MLQPYCTWPYLVLFIWLVSIRLKPSHWIWFSQQQLLQYSDFRPVSQLSWFYQTLVYSTCTSYCIALLTSCRIEYCLHNNMISAVKQKRKFWLTELVQQKTVFRFEMAMFSCSKLASVKKTHCGKPVAASKKHFQIWNGKEICNKIKWFWKKIILWSAWKKLAGVPPLFNFQNFEAAFLSSISAQDNETLHADSKGRLGECHRFLGRFRDNFFSTLL